MAEGVKNTSFRRTFPSADFNLHAYTLHDAVVSPTKEFYAVAKVIGILKLQTKTDL